MAFSSSPYWSFDGQAYACCGCLISHHQAPPGSPALALDRRQVMFPSPRLPEGVQAPARGRARPQHLCWPVYSGLRPAPSTHSPWASAASRSRRWPLAGRLQCVVSPARLLPFPRSSCPQRGLWREPAPPEDPVVDPSRRCWMPAPRCGGPRAGIPRAPRHGRDLTAVVRGGCLTSCGVWGSWLGFGDRISQLLGTSGKEQE